MHIEIPSIGLDLPVLPLTPRDGVINPPLLTAAYVIDSYGQPVGSPEEANNTLYIADTQPAAETRDSILCWARDSGTVPSIPAM